MYIGGHGFWRLGGGATVLACIAAMNVVMFFSVKLSLTIEASLRR